MSIGHTGKNDTHDLDNLNPRDALDLAIESLDIISDHCSFPEGLETEKHGWLQLYEIKDILKSTRSRFVEPDEDIEDIIV